MKEKLKKIAVIVLQGLGGILLFSAAVIAGAGIFLTDIALKCIKKKVAKKPVKAKTVCQAIAKAPGEGPRCAAPSLWTVSLDNQTHPRFNSSSFNFDQK